MSDFYDLVVVGAGTAGIPCALEASSRGVSVLLLDKAEDVGGTLHVSGGHMSAGGTSRQLERGIADSPAQHLADVLRISRGTGREDLIRLAVELAPGTVDWLQSEGFEFDPVTPRIVYGHAPYSVPRTYYGPLGGTSILAVLRPLLERSGVPVRLGARVTALVTVDDAVTGVRLGDGEEVGARHVVLATGGYGAAPELFEELDGRPLVTAASPDSTGDGLRLARAAGAGLAGQGTFIPTFGGLPHPEEPGRVLWKDRPLLVADERTPWEIYVDRSGHRFVAEDEPSIDEKERRLLELPDLTFFMILDDRAVAESADVIVGWTAAEFRAQAGRRKGIFSAQSLDGLAGDAGIDPAGLEATVAAYNAAVEAGSDALFGRRMLPAPIERAPFYAVQNHGVTLITFCGVDVDSNLAVRRPDGTVIEGLYAVGELLGAGATSGNSFCGGMLVTPSIALGRWLGARLATA